MNNWITRKGLRYSDPKYSSRLTERSVFNGECKIPCRFLHLFFSSSSLFAIKLPIRPAFTDEDSRWKEREKCVRIYIPDTSETPGTRSRVSGRRERDGGTEAHFRAYFWPTIIDKRPAPRTPGMLLSHGAVLSPRREVDDTFRGSIGEPTAGEGTRGVCANTGFMSVSISEAKRRPSKLKWPYSAKWYMPQWVRLSPGKRKKGGKRRKERFLTEF